MSCINIHNNIQDLEDLISDKKNNINPEQWDILIEEFKNASFTNKKDFVKFQRYIQTNYKFIITKPNLIKIYNHLKIDNPYLKTLITKKKCKSDSGVLVITVLTSAHPEYIDEKDGILKKAKFSCKHDCYYCPNEKAHEGNGWVDQPRSYLFSEPAVLRANQNDFDPILQMNSRLSNLINMGHISDKLEVLVLGGTWSEYPEEYQITFIRDLYYAANVYNDIDKRPKLTLEEEIYINEHNSKLHIIGLTLETRPDTITLDEIKKFRKYNCTRLQIGVQHTDNNILKKINRGHDIECVYKAIKLLKNNCYKVDIHLMPNLPGSSYEIDTKMLNDSLYDERLQVDQYKIYPCAVVPFTKIKQWFDEGSYVPYPDEQLYQLIKNFKMKVQKYKRLNRIIRDIPSSYIEGGYNDKTICLRQTMQKDMIDNNWKCKCIRCREIKDNLVNINDVKLCIEKYNSSDGIEYFISYETEDYLIGFIRLRINYDYTDVLPVLKNCGLIRELHVYSNLSNVGNNSELSMQHKGFGRRLIKKAEEITLEHNLYKVAIISGTGVRNYYRKYGYELQDTYMIKNLCDSQYYYNYCSNIINKSLIYFIPIIPIIIIGKYKFRK
jgi:ELP3 family radical SAM enzyme/protein acetyltransferase